MAVGLYTLDVGHGLCHAVVFSGRRCVLIDGGSARARGVVEQFLERFQIATVVAYVATHNDSDHVGAAIHLLDRYKTADDLWTIWFLYDRGSNQRIELEEYAARRMREGTIKRWQAAYINTASSGQPKPKRIFADRAEDAVLDLVYPRIEDVTESFRTRKPSSRLQNRSSACLRLRVGQSVALVTGDIDLFGLTRIIRDYRMDVRAQMLVVPHHGGRIPGGADMLSWDEVVGQVGPEVAVVSSGKSTVIQEETFRPFIQRRIPVVCTEITPACHEGCLSFHPCVRPAAAADAPQMAGRSEFPEAIGCFGSVVAVLRPGAGGLSVRAVKPHQQAIDARVTPPPGTPYCRE